MSTQRYLSRDERLMIEGVFPGFLPELGEHEQWAVLDRSHPDSLVVRHDDVVYTFAYHGGNLIAGVEGDQIKGEMVDWTKMEKHVRNRLGNLFLGLGSGDSDRNLRFTELWNRCREIPFDPAYGSGDGYFDGACAEGVIELRPTDHVRMETPSGRRIIVVGTSLGNYAVFDRHSTSRDTFCYSASQDLLETEIMPRPVFGRGGLDDEGVFSLLGYPSNDTLDGTISVQLRTIFKLMSRRYKSSK